MKAVVAVAWVQVDSVLGEVWVLVEGGCWVLLIREWCEVVPCTFEVELL